MISFSSRGIVRRGRVGRIAHVEKVRSFNGGFGLVVIFVRLV